MFAHISRADQQAAYPAFVKIEALIQVNFPIFILRIAMVHGPAFQLGRAAHPFEVKGFAHMDAELQMPSHAITLTPKPLPRPT